MREQNLAATNLRKLSDDNRRNKRCAPERFLRFQKIASVHDRYLPRYKRNSCREIVKRDVKFRRRAEEERAEFFIISIKCAFCLRTATTTVTSTGFNSVREFIERCVPLWTGFKSALTLIDPSTRPYLAGTCIRGKNQVLSESFS